MNFTSFLGKIKDQAEEFIEQNPEQVESLKHQAVGFVKTVVDNEAEKEKESSGKPQTKADETKAQILGVLKPKLDEFTESYNAPPQEEETKPPPGKPSYLIGKPSNDQGEEAPAKPAPAKPSYLIGKPKKDDNKEEEVEEAAPPSKPAPGKPSYLIGKPKKDEEEEEPAEAAPPPKPSKPAHGKPSYLIKKKKDPAEEEEAAYNEAVQGSE
ncbi:unnamed protein product [Pseudo-nitzschia multistriata]|uniref:Uncharacterized protein n=1 Tax=Pseudo-nitzschia multistriata TaxID=183589 RepID=A0A448ZE51_9STRA|nr:unnamed protein product [Pseudo-nitzschia multistriata]